MTSINRLFILREAADLSAAVAFLSNNWQALTRDGKCLAVSVSIHTSVRSPEQNRRYFGPAVLGCIAQQARVNGRRHSVEIWHDLFKRMFIGVVELPNGELIAKSSTGLTVEQFSKFMNEVEAYAAQELGVVFDD